MLITSLRLYIHITLIMEPRAQIFCEEKYIHIVNFENKQSNPLFWKYLMRLHMFSKYLESSSIGFLFFLQFFSFLWYFGEYNHQSQMVHHNWFFMWPTLKALQCSILTIFSISVDQVTFYLHGENQRIPFKLVHWILDRSVYVALTSLLNPQK